MSTIDALLKLDGVVAAGACMFVETDKTDHNKLYATLVGQKESV